MNHFKKIEGKFLHYFLCLMIQYFSLIKEPEQVMIFMIQLDSNFENFAFAKIQIKVFILFYTSC
jgi:hypothetical protein